MKRTRALFVIAVVLSGCAGLIGVPDLEYTDGTADGGGGGGDARADGNVGIPDATNATDGSRPDGQTPISDAGPDAITHTPDSATCDLSTIGNDPKNCGRCGHDCLGAACTAGMCEAIPLGNAVGAAFRYVIAHGDYLYASTFYRAQDSQPGIYRISKADGSKVKLVDRPYPDHLAIVGETLYFTDNDYQFDNVDGGRTGGIWSCPLGDTCTPTLLEVSEEPRGIAVHGGEVFWSEHSSGFIRGHALDAGPDASTRNVGVTDYLTFLDYLWSDGDVYTLGGFSGRSVLMAYPKNGDGGAGTELSRSNNPFPGGLVGTSTAFFYAVNDFENGTGGEVRRVRRPEAPLTETTCSYGNATENVRPSGVYVDGTNLYWTNLGDVEAPWARGSVATCAQQGPCCATPTILWRGSDEPSAITGDDKAIYWVTYRRGDVFKMAKP